MIDQKLDTTSECGLRGKPSKPVHNGEKNLESKRTSFERAPWPEDTDELPPQVSTSSFAMDFGNEIRFNVSNSPGIRHINKGSGIQNKNIGSDKQNVATYQVFGKDD